MRVPDRWWLYRFAWYRRLHGGRFMMSRGVWIRVIDGPWPKGQPIPPRTAVNITLHSVALTPEQVEGFKRTGVIDLEFRNEPDSNN